jgi:hypothetical protein
VFLIVSLATLIMVVMKTEMPISCNNKIKGNEELMLLILNCTLPHDQNDRWTLACHFLVVCCRNIYLRMLKKSTLLDKYCYLTLEHFY